MAKQNEEATSSLHPPLLFNCVRSPHAINQSDSFELPLFVILLLGAFGGKTGVWVMDQQATYIKELSAFMDDAFDPFEAHFEIAQSPLPRGST